MKDSGLTQRRDVTLRMAIRAAKRGDLKPVQVKEARKKLYLHGKNRK